LDGGEKRRRVLADVDAVGIGDREPVDDERNRVWVCAKGDGVV